MYRLVPIDSTKNAIILHANFNDKGGFDAKQQMIITHLMSALEQYNIKVIGALFDGDLSAV